MDKLTKPNEIQEQLLEAVLRIQNRLETDEPTLVAAYNPFVHQFDPLYLPYPGEVNFMASETIPDQSMSVAEIMRRYASGLPLGGERVPMYDDDDSDEITPDFRNMDLADVEAFKDSAREELQEIKEKLVKSKTQEKPKEEQKVLETVPTKDAQSTKTPEG